MTITWYNLSSFESAPEVVSDSLVAQIVTDGGLHLGEPVQHLLVGKTVKRTSKTVQTSSQRQHWGAESRSDQVSGVGTDVSSLVIGVNGEVESHQLDEVLVLSKAELVGEVERVILVLLNLSNLSSLEDVLVDAGSNGWELGDQIHGVLEGVLPVLSLLHALGVSLCECGLVLKSSDCE